jgi:hypothetical protein
MGVEFGASLIFGLQDTDLDVLESAAYRWADEVGVNIAYVDERGVQLTDEFQAPTPSWDPDLTREERNDERQAIREEWISTTEAGQKRKAFWDSFPSVRQEHVSELSSIGSYLVLTRAPHYFCGSKGGAITSIDTSDIECFDEEKGLIELRRLFEWSREHDSDDWSDTAKGWHLVASQR